MKLLFNELYNYIIFLINSSSIWGPILACILIFWESILPILPLFVFITILFITFGPILGFILSYVLTCTGCIFSFFLFRNFLKIFFDKKIRSKDRINSFMKTIENINFCDLVVLISIPFTPAFLINVIGGLSKIKFKKYFFAIITGKIFLVFFWGFIGTSLIESLKQPTILIIIFIMLIISFFISKIITKRLNFK